MPYPRCDRPRSRAVPGLFKENTATSTREVLLGSAALTGLEGEWDALADAVGAPPWWRPGWVRAWMSAFGRGPLVLVVIRDGRELVGLVPLQRVGSELRSTTNYHTPSFGLLATDAVARDDLAAAVIAVAPRRLSIGFLPGSEDSITALERAAGGAGRHRHRRVLERCPFIITDGETASPHGHLAREVRRRERRLQARGELTFEVHDGSIDLERLLADGFAVESAGWKGQQGSAIASSPATLTFYRSIASFLAARGALRLAYLRCAGRPIAFDFAVEEGGVHSLLKTGYDPAFRADGPGVLLRARMIERAVASDIRRYDFLGHDDPWKRRWTSQAEAQSLFQAFRGPLGMVDWATQVYLRPVARRVVRR